MESTTQPKTSYDIFNLTDDALSSKLEFVEEIGYGNWGSVWLVKPRAKPSNDDGFDRLHKNKLAVKLVHRRPDDLSKSKTTAARVKSLWNEMKIVGSFKSDPHPVIIPFYSFIVTPSYALITMAYHPALIPVEVEESRARTWLRYLLSGVEFLHKRGVVHNDIKPANILLSYNNVPVLVDFGFAERYDTTSNTAFHSNLSYGTPEYLSPERARGLPHDTRKSDVWSLGVTLFEILVGRTPFEESDKDAFTTKADLERYWSRTLRGKWIGSWKLSTGVERLLRRMLSPNADLRCTASQAMLDSYWSKSPDGETHRKSLSVASSIVFEKDLSKLMEAPPLRSPALGKENKPATASPPGLDPRRLPNEPDKNGARHTITRARSQPKVQAKAASQRPKRVPVPALGDLSAIAGSPTTSPAQGTAGESRARKPLGALAPKRINNVATPTLSNKPSKARGITDALNVSQTRRDKPKGKENTSVNQRVREWEREKQRLREIARLEEIEREREADQEEKEEWEELADALEVARQEREDQQRERERQAASPTPATEGRRISRVLSPTPTLNASIASRRSSRALLASLLPTPASGTPADAPEEAFSRREESERESWEDEALIREAKSSLPVVRHAIHNERMGADNQSNRMSIWMRNVEKVVEDARQTFASSSKPATLPPLPLAPLSRSGSRSRTSRLPRKVLAASQIFSDDGEPLSNEVSMSSYVTSIYATPEQTGTKEVFSPTSQVIPEIRTPSKQWRSTLSGGSTPAREALSPDDIDTGSPSKRKEKSRSHGNLFQRRIRPVSQLELEVQTAEHSLPLPSPRLSAVVDKSLFITPPNIRQEEEVSEGTPVRITKSFDELTASPQVVEPYPERKIEVVAPDTPNRHRLEAVYDRFLMATSGVKRVGKGYQFDNKGPVTSRPSPKASSSKHFYTARRPMPPPVSSDQLRKTSVDELGVMTYSGTASPKDHGNTTATLVRRAFNAFVPGKTVSRRASRIS